MTTTRYREGARQIAPSRTQRGFFDLSEKQNSNFGKPAQDPTDSEPVTDRRRADLYILAMTAALTVLTGSKYLRPFNLYSREEQELERVRDMLRTCIARRRRNLRRTVTGRRS